MQGSWQLDTPDEAAVAELARALDVPQLLARLLLNREISDPDAAGAFLAPQLKALPDPFAMRDAERAANRLADAVEQRQRVCVYGDYDVDGVSAAALMSSFLASLGAPPRVFLPDRFRDGYGLHEGRLAELCDDGVQLFVSVDCGSTAVGAIAGVRALGVDFIVVDHHQLGPELPDATAHLNPRLPGCGLASEPLSAVGVALVLAQATRRVLANRGFFGSGGPPPIADLLELAALGTIADMVPLRGMNRILAWHGLRRLGRSRRPGVQALARHSKVLEKCVAADHVGFVLGPRINAAGRVSEARFAYDLLTTTDRELAESLAVQVEIDNTRRKSLQKDVGEAAMAAAAACPGRAHAVVVAGTDWHSGVVGIVASRVKDAFDVPSFVLSVEDGVARGSGRSIPGYDLVEGLRALDPSLFERFGGHAFAAGVTLPADKIDAFATALAAHVAATLPPEQRIRPLRLDAEMQPADVTLETVDMIERMEPFGKGNRKPLFLFRAVEVAEVRKVGGGAWVKARFVEQGERPVWARHGFAAFASAEVLGELQKGDFVDVAARVERNVFRGQQSAEASVVAVRAVAE